MEFVVVTIPLPDEVVKVPGVPPSNNTGEGNVDTVNDVLPDENGNVELTPSDIGAEPAGAAAAAETAAKAYADALVVGLWDDRGNYNASTNLFPAAGGSGTAGAILKGDIWTVSVAGVLGGVAVAAGDTVRALIDVPGQTASNWAIGETNVGYVPENTANKKNTITNSEVDFPSTKAVFDALMGGQFIKNIFPNPTIITHTGSTSEVKLLSVLVPANTLKSLDQLILLIRGVTISGGGGNKTWRVYLHTSDTLPVANGPQQIAMQTSTSTMSSIKRNMWLSSPTTLRQQLRDGTFNTDEQSGFSGSAHQTSITVDLTVDNYLILSGQLSNGAESMSVYQTQCLIVRP